MSEKIRTPQRAAAVNAILQAIEHDRLTWRPLMRGWSADVGGYTIHVAADSGAITLLEGDAFVADLSAGVNGAYRVSDALRRKLDDTEYRAQAFTKFCAALEEVGKGDDGRDRRRKRPAGTGPAAEPA